jgi:sporulation protein YlmC with PRC-barrel domain
MKENNMKQQLSILAGGLLAFCLPLQTQAQNTPSPIPPASISAEGNFGPKTKWSDLTEIKVTNTQGEVLGRIQDLTLDLSNGRIVEVLVVSGQVLRMGGKTVAVPPTALMPDSQKKVYVLDVSAAAWKDAPAFDLSKWAASTQTDQIAAVYHYFGQEPTFLLTGEAPGRTLASDRPVTSLGIVERMSKLINMPVDNMQGKNLGKLQSLVVDVPHGNILNAYINASNFGTPLEFSTVISPTMLSFNAKRDELLLDVSKVAYDKEPNVIFQDGSGGQVVASREQAASGPHTDVALVQGTSFGDINTTAKIDQAIQTGDLASWGVEVATLNGRVTLRGSVNNQGTKDSIGALAITVVNLDNVDNQIVVAGATMITTPAVVINPPQASL